VAPSGDDRHEAWRGDWAQVVRCGLRRWPRVDSALARSGRRRVLEHPPKTPASRRAVPLDAATPAELKAWKTQQTAEQLEWGPAWVGDGWVFTAGNGAPLHPGVVTKRFGEAVAGADVPSIRLTIFATLHHLCTRAPRLCSQPLSTGRRDIAMRDSARRNREYKRSTGGVRACGA
jgi:hypothetical protein